MSNWQYDGRYDNVPGPLTRTGHKKAEKAALHDSLAYRPERQDNGELRYVLPTTHEVFDGLIRRGYTITPIEEVSERPTIKTGETWVRTTVEDENWEREAVKDDR